MDRTTKSWLVIVPCALVMWALFFWIRFPLLRNDIREWRLGELRSTYSERASDHPTLASVRQLMDEVLEDHLILKERTEKLYRQVGFAQKEIDSLQARLKRLGEAGHDGAAGFDLICASGGADDLIGIIRHVVHESSALCANDLCSDHVVEIAGLLDLSSTGPRWCENVFSDRTLDQQVEVLGFVRTALLMFVQEVVLSYDFPASVLPRSTAS